MALVVGVLVVFGVAAASIIIPRLADAPASKEPGGTPQATVDAFAQAVADHDGDALCALLTPDERESLGYEGAFPCEQHLEARLDDLELLSDVGSVRVGEVRRSGTTATAGYQWDDLESTLDLVLVDGDWLVEDGTFTMLAAGGRPLEIIERECRTERRTLETATSAYLAQTGRPAADLEVLVEDGFLRDANTLGHTVVDGEIVGACPR